jgi:hypothetical protein
MATYVYGQDVGLTGLCAAKTQILDMAGLWAIGGIAWNGMKINSGVHAGDGTMDVVVHRIPGLLFTFLPAGIAAWWGIAKC